MFPDDPYDRKLLIRGYLALMAVGLCVIALPACTTAQEAATLSAVNKYQADVSSACMIAETATNSAAGAFSNPNVSTAADLIHSACDTESAIAALVLSPTSVAWLNTLITTVQSRGANVPPAPIETVVKAPASS